MERWTTLTGRVYEFETPAPDVAAFLARVVAAANDPDVTESAMVALVYGPENPILDQTIFEARGAVTRDNVDDPVLGVMRDLLDQKRVQLGTLDKDAALADFTVTVREAAARLGVHQSAVRQAIAAHRLAAAKKGARWYISEASLDSFKLDRRGPAPRVALQVRTGNDDGVSFRFFVAPGELEDVRRAPGKSSVVEGVVRRFDRAAVISGPKGRHQFFELEPATQEDELEFGGFFVRGKFRVVRRVGNHRRAGEAWREIKAGRVG